MSENVGTPVSADKIPVAPQPVPMMQREDTWAIIIALGLVLVSTMAFFAGSFGMFKTMAVGFAPWTDFGKALNQVGAKFGGIVVLYLFFLIVFGYAVKVMGV